MKVSKINNSNSAKIQKYLNQLAVNFQTVIDGNSNHVIEKVIDGHIYTRPATRQEVLENELEHAISVIEHEIEPLCCTYMNDEVTEENKISLYSNDDSLLTDIRETLKTCNEAVTDSNDFLKYNEKSVSELIKFVEYQTDKLRQIGLDIEGYISENDLWEDEN